MRDAAADLGRRAWLACPACDDCGDPREYCAACANGKCCDAHWCFLLAAEGPRLFVQCHRCWRRWWHDTGFGVGDRPAELDRPVHFEFPDERAA